MKKKDTGVRFVDNYLTEIGSSSFFRCVCKYIHTAYIHIYVIHLLIFLV